ncbi:MAG: MAPEG family protein [Parvularculaceae bacterium]|nr:MAPEG family protein [Parvularculaceae bacterium]
MTSLQAAALWIGLNAIFLIFISWRVGQGRIKHKINLGDAGNDDMQRRIRAQGNYIEYAPAALLGLFVLAQLGLAANAIHALGGFFLIARVSHFMGLGMGVWPMGRFIGTLSTMLVLLATGALLIWKALA